MTEADLERPDRPLEAQISATAARACAAAMAPLHPSIEHDPCPSEQRIDRALQAPDHRADPAPLDQPALATGLPLAAGLQHHAIELVRALDRDHRARLTKLARTDVIRDLLVHSMILRALSPPAKGLEEPR
jgi:hypothetical protein